MKYRLGSDKTKEIWLAGIYYIPAVLLYVINMFVPAVRPGVIATVFMLCVAAELILRRQIVFKTFMDRLVTVYFAYNALSVIWLLRSGMPFSVYAGEFVVSLLPMIFYFAAGSRYFYRNYTAAILFTGIIGIILQMIMPQFYIDFSYKIGFASMADAATCRVRMDSVVGSTVLGFLAVAGMLVSIPFIMKGTLSGNGSGPDAAAGEASKKPGVNGVRAFGIASMLINMIVVFMCNQRSAMVVAILVVVYFNVLLFFAYGVRKKKDFLIELIILAAGFLLFCIIKQDAALKAYYRLVSLPGAIGQRSEQWVAAVNNMYSTWLGNGLGANGHRAIGVEDAFVVADGGIVKMYCEQGIFGFSMFIYIMILTFKKGIGNIKEYCAEVGIMAAMLLQSIGSNILAFQLAGPIFWFAVGRIHASDETVRQQGERGKDTEKEDRS